MYKLSSITNVHMWYRRSHDGEVKRLSIICRCLNVTLIASNTFHNVISEALDLWGKYRANYNWVFHHLAALFKTAVLVQGFMLKRKGQAWLMAKFKVLWCGKEPVTGVWEWIPGLRWEWIQIGKRMLKAQKISKICLPNAWTSVSLVGLYSRLLVTLVFCIPPMFALSASPTVQPNELILFSKHACLPPSATRNCLHPMLYVQIILKIKYHLFYIISPFPHPFFLLLPAENQEFSGRRNLCLFKNP